MNTYDSLSNIYTTILSTTFIMIVCILVVVVGCENKSYGPPFLTECNWEETVSMTFTLYDSEEDMKSAYEFLSKAVLLKDDVLKGFATKNTRTNLHTLHFLKPRGQNDHDRIETIGHEALHPVCGAWHP